MASSSIMVVARVLGVVSSASSAVLWVVFLLNPYGGQGGDSLKTRLIAFAMIGLSAWGVAVSIKMRARWLAVAAVASLVPIGLYVALTPGVFKWIGLFNALMLLAAIVMGLAKRSAGGPRRSRT